MKYVAEYKVVSEKYFHTLQSEVNALLKTGWQPLGNLSTATDRGLVVYTQAMVKYH